MKIPRAPGPGLLGVHRVNLPLRRPHVAAHGIESVRDVILVSWTADGAPTGWGECPTLSSAGYTDVTTGRAWHAMVTLIGPAFVDQARLSEPDVDLPMALGAVRDALADAADRAAGRSLSERIGADRAPRSTREVIGLDSDVPVGDAPIKLKVTPASLDLVKAVRRGYPDRHVAVDANGSFASVADVVAWLEALGPDHGLLDYFEQPLRPADLQGHAELRRLTPVPVALDESIGSLEDLSAAVAVGALDLLNVKSSRLGGIDAAVAAVELAKSEQIGAFIGGMLETGIGRAGGLALAGLTGISGPTDLGPSDRYFETDVCAPIVADRSGRLVPPDGPGIGCSPDPAVFDRLVVAREEFIVRSCPPG